MQHNSTMSTWTDEAGNPVPLKYISKTAKLQEKSSFALLKDAKRLNEDLAAYKQKMREICDQVHDSFMQERSIDKLIKGNFTWKSFDGSVKVEVSISDRIEFDDLTIAACKSKLDEFLSGNIESKDEAVKTMIMDAFSNTKGNMDTKKVLGLLRYADKIKNPLFSEAMDLLKESIRRPDSKKYFRIAERLEDGSYQNIDLNFSSI